MSKETLLKKDFLEKDVQRLRNLVGNKFGNKTRDQVGFSKKEDEHVEGDIWEENNKTWTIKNGLVQTYTKLDSVRNMYRLPLVCPSCKGKMGSNLDKKMYPFHHTCFDCVVKKETALKLTGEYETYAKNIMKNNAYTFIDEAKDFIVDYSESEAGSFYTEEGEKENWVGEGSKNQNVDKMLSELDELKDQVAAV